MPRTKIEAEIVQPTTNGYRPSEKHLGKRYNEHQRGTVAFP